MQRPAKERPEPWTLGSSFRSIVSLGWRPRAVGPRASQTAGFQERAANLWVCIVRERLTETQRLADADFQGAKPWGGSRAV